MDSKYPIEPMKVANEIISGLWLGSIDSADISFLKPRKIESVLTILGDKKYVRRFNGQINHEIIIMNDGDPFDPNDIQRGIDFLKEYHANGSNVLVHCLAGISRSTSLVAGYLMEIFDWNPHQAIHFIVEKRIIVAPATDTYNSVIKFIHGKNNKFFCKRCSKDWIYIAGYDLYYYQRAFDDFCSCSNPELIIKPEK